MKKTLSLLLLSGALVAFNANNTNVFASSDMAEERDDLALLSQSTISPPLENDSEAVFVGPGDGKVTVEDGVALVEAVTNVVPVAMDAVGTVSGLLGGKKDDDESGKDQQGHSLSGPGNGKLDKDDLVVVKGVVPTFVGVAKDVVTNVDDVAGFAVDTVGGAFEWLFSNDTEEKKSDTQNTSAVGSAAEDEAEVPVSDSE